MRIDTATAINPRTLSVRCAIVLTSALTTLILLASSMMLASATAHADSAPSLTLNRALIPFSASYKVGNDTVTAGEAVLALSRSDSGTDWRYSLETEPKGLFKLAGRGYVQETSTFAVVKRAGGDIIQPKAYQFRQDNQSKRSIDATFNWDQRVLYFHRGNDQSTTAIKYGTLDRLTMTLAMMSNFTTDFENRIIEVFDGGRLKEVELLNEGVETINTSLGELETVIVRTRTVGGSRRQTITWLAPALNNLPVRIEQLKNNELVARLSIRRYTEGN